MEQIEKQKNSSIKGITFKQVTSADERNSIIETINGAIERCNCDEDMGKIPLLKTNKITFWFKKSEDRKGFTVNLGNVKYGFVFQSGEWVPASYMINFNYNKIKFNDKENGIFCLLFNDKF